MMYEVVVNGVVKMMTEYEYHTTEIDSIQSVRVMPINDSVQYTSLNLEV